MELQAKQKEGALTEKEHEELMSLIGQIEALEGKRLESMIALAELWNISLEELRERLGIKAPEPLSGRYIYLPAGYFPSRKS